MSLSVIVMMEPGKTAARSNTIPTQPSP